jgi:beta-galactosidase
MERRDFIKQVAAYPLALPAARALEQLGEPAIRKEGRRQILDLSGHWRLRMDQTDRGRDQKWFLSEPPNSVARVIPIHVPSIWQQFLDVDGGIGWYFKSFSLPEQFLHGVLHVRFGAADYAARVWLNGQEVGYHEGGFTPFEFDLRGAARVGENQLVVRVSDVARDFRLQYDGLPGWERPSGKRIDGFVFAEIPAGWQDWREGFNHCGIWLPVEIFAYDSVYIADAFVLPNFSAKAFEVRVQIMNETGKTVNARVGVDVKPWERGTGSNGGGERAVRLNRGLTSVTLTADIHQARAWSPEDPFLYSVEVYVQQGSQRRDDLSVRSGLRELTVSSDGYFHLNEKRIFLKGAHYQSTEPLTLVAPYNREMARRIVEVAKEGGFNFMRYQGRPTAPSILDAADELGIMVQCEPAVSKMADNARMEELATRETKELIKRDRSRPSIVIWCMINEQNAGMRVVQKMVQVARELDPSRVITESAGGPSHYYLPYSTEGVSYLDEHYYQGSPLSEGVLEYWRNRGIPGQLYFVTEFGYGTLEDVDAVLEKYGPHPVKRMEDYHGFAMQKIEMEDAYHQTEASKIFPTLAAYREAAQTVQANAHKLTVESFRSNPRLGGFNCVQLFDSNSNEVDGLVDFWRNKRKKSFYMFQKLNQPLQLIIQFTPLNPKAGREIELRVTLVNENCISGRKTLLLRAIGPSGVDLFSRNEPVNAEPWSTRLFEGNISVGQEPGPVTLEVELRDGDQPLIRKRERFSVYHPRELAWPAEGFALFDPQNGWPPGNRRQELRIREYDPELDQPEVVVTPAFVALWRQRAEFQKFLRLMDQVRRGSTVLFLGIPSDGPPPFNHRAFGNTTSFSSLTVSAALGFTLRPDGAWISYGFATVENPWGKPTPPYGGATGNSRAGSPVTSHPCFRGLPGPGLMDWEYGNVVAEQIAYPFRLSSEDTGPDIKVIDLANGKVVFCTLNLLKHLEYDGVAEKLLSNLVGYLHRQLPAQLRPRTPREEESLRFHEGQVRDIWEKLLSRPQHE